MPREKGRQFPSGNATEQKLYKYTSMTGIKGNLFTKSRLTWRRTMGFAKRWFLQSTTENQGDSQYYTQFEKWKVKKRQTGNKWKFISQRLRKRKLEGRESDVYMNGFLIPERS
ncbi:hypothetical protein AJ78_00002 [Emergomyces pasteurianus Ep9510]|uniref:Uncharacterized protein n=1 Tax=Emergomyces pasteurianus Ep9510 TaxID=1447872 RepID=A0A1J9QIG1_9EURO|nr:hypothetical protein AJ78_00002 [Emergomyces pasteurianus Ep9510]